MAREADEGRRRIVAMQTSLTSLDGRLETARRAARFPTT